MTRPAADVPAPADVPDRGSDWQTTPRPERPGRTFLDRQERLAGAFRAEGDPGGPLSL